MQIHQLSVHQTGKKMHFMINRTTKLDLYKTFYAIVSHLCIKAIEMSFPWISKMLECSRYAPLWLCTFIAHYLVVTFVLVFALDANRC